MKPLKILSYYFLLCLASLSLIIFSLTGLLKVTFLNENFMKEKINEEDYMDKVYTSITTEMSHYLTQSHLPESIFDGVITKEKVKEDVLASFSSMYEDKDFSLNTQDITTNLENNIFLYLDNQNVTLKDTESLEAFIKQISDIYEEEINLYGMFPKIKKAILPLNKLVQILLLISLGLFLISLGLIKFLLKEKVGSTVLFTSGLLLIIIKIYIYKQVDIAHLLIVDSNFSSLLKNILTTYFDKMLLIGFLLLGLGFVYLVIRTGCHFKER